MSVEWKDLLIRAGKTFLQGFLAIVTVGIMGVTDFTTLGTLLFAGLVGGLAALFSLAQNWVKATS